MSLKSHLAAVVAKVAPPGRPEAGAAGPESTRGTLPDPFLQLMERAWRAQPDDSAGWWCITLAEDPRTPADGALPIAMLLSRDLANHITKMHNNSLACSDAATGLS